MLVEKSKTYVEKPELFMFQEMAETFTNVLLPQALIPLSLVWLPHGDCPGHPLLISPRF